MIALTFADPVSLTAVGTLIGGLAGAGGLAATLFGPKPKAPTMPSPGQPAQTPTGTPGGTGGAGGPSFLAAAAAPPAAGSTGGKTLLGQ